MIEWNIVFDPYWLRPSEIIDAIEIARDLHRAQVRKYTNEPYFSHLMYVGGLASAYSGIFSEDAFIVGLLHDSVEDQNYPLEAIEEKFGTAVSDAVFALSEVGVEGNRKFRQETQLEKLEKAPGWVQNVKYADIISNAQNIAFHDKKFGKVYLPEKEAQLSVMIEGHPRLRSWARRVVSEGICLV